MKPTKSRPWLVAVLVAFAVVGLLVLVALIYRRPPEQRAGETVRFFAVVGGGMLFFYLADKVRDYFRRGPPTDGR